MKTGMTLVEMATELERQRGAKRDFIADTRKVALDDPGIDVLLLQEEIVREPHPTKESNLRRVNEMVASGEIKKPVSFVSMISHHFTDYSRDLRKELPHLPFMQEPDKTMRAMRGVLDYVAARDFAARVAGKPNLNGIWQALNTANWDLQTHAPSAGPPQYGTLLTVPPGIGVTAPAIPWTASKSTSPTIPSVVREMPTSITVAPGLTMSAVSTPLT